MPVSNCNENEIIGAIELVKKSDTEKFAKAGLISNVAQASLDGLHITT